MAGFEYKKSSWEGMGIVASQFPYDGSLMNNIGTSEQEKPTISSYKGASEMASFLARLNYSLASKYILTVRRRFVQLLERASMGRFSGSIGSLAYE